jgi:Asp-tRNA(Asn)/Glu-tRNA(Gln) amidotransferase A subunit family amidase
MSSAVQASPLGALKAAYSSGETEPVEQARRSLERANGNASRNTYIALDGEWTLAEAKRQTERGAGALLGLPVSLKDCFDLEGFETSSGSKFYAAHKGRVSEDSAVAARLRAAGAVIVGKTNLHQLA